MAVPVIQDADDAGGTGITVQSVTLDLGSTANRAVWAQFLDAQVNTNLITALTLDGVSVLGDLVGPTTVNDRPLYNLHHVTTLTGLKVLEVTWNNSSGFKSMVAVALHTVNPTSPFSGRQTDGSSAFSSVTATVTSNTDSLVLMAAQNSNGFALTPGAGSSAISGISGTFRNGLQETGASPNVTIGGTWASPEAFWASAVSVAGASSGFTLALDNGTHTVTGQDVSLLAQRTLPLDAGTLSVTGQDINLVKQTPGALVLSLDAGSYNIVGSDALVNLSMNLDSGTHTSVGQNIDFIRTFPQAYSLALDAGSLNIAGTAIALRWSGAPIVPAKNTGLAMSLRIGL